MKVKAVRSVIVALAALVIDGALFTVRAKAWVTVTPEPVALNVRGYEPPAPVGMPLTVAVPLLLSVNVRPAGSAPVWAIAGMGAPLVTTVKLNVDPIVAVARAALVIVGFAVTVSTNDWVVVPAVFLAVKVNG